eukprot:COSAG06_NODE_575_length_14056_cov_25.763345_1_plen_35_part_00
MLGGGGGVALSFSPSLTFISPTRKAALGAGHSVS